MLINSSQKQHGNKLFCKRLLVSKQIICHCTIKAKINTCITYPGVCENHIHSRFNDDAFDVCDAMNPQLYDHSNYEY
jgi:hypothetical protein